MFLIPIFLIFLVAGGCDCSYELADTEDLINLYHSGQADFVGEDGFFYDCCTRYAIYERDDMWYEYNITANASKFSAAPYTQPEFMTVHIAGISIDLPCALEPIVRGVFSL